MDKNLCYEENNASMVLFISEHRKGTLSRNLIPIILLFCLCVLYNLLRTCYIIASIDISQFSVKFNSIFRDIAFDIVIVLVLIRFDTYS